MFKMTIPSHLSFGLFSHFSPTLRFLLYLAPPGGKIRSLTPASLLRAGGISSGWDFHDYPDFEDSRAHGIAISGKGQKQRQNRTKLSTGSEEAREDKSRMEYLQVARQYFQDTSESSDDNTNVVNALREPCVVNQDPGVKSSQDPPQIDHNCCLETVADSVYCQESLDKILEELEELKRDQRMLKELKKRTAEEQMAKEIRESEEMRKEERWLITKLKRNHKY
ncbi:hypothetical protein Tco_0002583 [Tanacetum coccineum]